MSKLIRERSVEKVIKELINIISEKKDNLIMELKNIMILCEIKHLNY